MASEKDELEQVPSVDAAQWEPLESHDLEGVEEVRRCWRDPVNERDGWESTRARDHGHDGWER